MSSGPAQLRGSPQPYAGPCAKVTMATKCARNAPWEPSQTGVIFKRTHKSIGDLSLLYDKYGQCYTLVHVTPVYPPSWIHCLRLCFLRCRDKAVVNKYFLSVFVRLFLEKRERSLMKFIGDFQKLTVSDEKVICLTL